MQETKQYTGDNAVAILAWINTPHPPTRIAGNAEIKDGELILYKGILRIVVNPGQYITKDTSTGVSIHSSLKRHNSMSDMNSIDDTLDQREETHGDFTRAAVTARTIKGLYSNLLTECPNSVILEGLDMIASKLARICNGDPMEPDHWHDIAGYATLVERHLRKEDQ